MTKDELKELNKADLIAYFGKDRGVPKFPYLFRPNLKIVRLTRLAYFYRDKARTNIFYKFVFYVVFVYKRLFGEKYGLQIGISKKDGKIGKELRIVHPGLLIVHGDAKLGDNVTLLQGVAIGQNGDGKGDPTLGDNVFVGPGAKF